jgi:hypothetical protein
MPFVPNKNGAGAPPPIAAVPKIERGIPMPAGASPRGLWGRIAAQMQAGDSVLCPMETNAKTIGGALKKLGHKYSTRKVDGGWRVWRVE